MSRVYLWLIIFGEYSVYAILFLQTVHSYDLIFVDGVLQLVRWLASLMLYFLLSFVLVACMPICIGTYS